MVSGALPLDNTPSCPPFSPVSLTFPHTPTVGCVHTPLLGAWPFLRMGRGPAGGEGMCKNILYWALQLLRLVVVGQSKVVVFKVGVGAPLGDHDFNPGVKKGWVPPSWNLVLNTTINGFLLTEETKGKTQQMHFPPLASFLSKHFPPKDELLVMR